MIARRHFHMSTKTSTGARRRLPRQSDAAVAPKSRILLAPLLILLILTSCRSAPPGTPVNPGATSAPAVATNTPLNIQVKATVSTQSTVLPITIQADVKSPKELSVPITVKSETSSPVPLPVSLRISNASSDQIVVPIRLQFETNVLPLSIAIPPAGTNSDHRDQTQATPAKTRWYECLPFWAMISIIALVLLWFATSLYASTRLRQPQNTQPASTASPASTADTSSPADSAKEMPVRALSAACAIIAAIHFYNSSGRADTVLLGLLALGAAPWLGKFIKKIGKDGIEYAEQGLTFAPPQPQTSPAPTVAQGAPTTPEPDRTVVAPPRDEAQQRPPTEGAQTQPQLTFASLSYHERKVLATLWKYQRRHFGEQRQPRWTFTVRGETPANMAFSTGCLGLFGKGLAEVAPSGQVMLSERAFDFCNANAAQLGQWGDTYDNYSS
jgi:hypothetical protein